MARRVERGHLWVYSNEVERVEGDPAPGDAVEVYSQRGHFLGVGAYSPHSLIRIRIWSRQHIELDGSLIRERIQQALDYRRELYGCDPLAGRMVFSEGDGLPGLVVDRFNDVLSIQILSTGIESRRSLVLDALIAVFSPRAIVERSDAPAREHEGLEIRSGVVYGDLSETAHAFREPRDGLTYLANLLSGQKTGFFFDQAANRAKMARWAAGKRVLDVFCYTGAWGLAAAAAGAREVVFVDSSQEALDLAKQQMDLNNMKTPASWVEADAFAYLKERSSAGDSYDCIALDPPAFAKSSRHVEAALKGYREINVRAMRMLAPGGRLFTSSCSQHISRDDFGEMLKMAARDAGRTFVIHEELGQAPDHPIVLGMPETRYLKCFHLRRID